VAQPALPIRGYRQRAHKPASNHELDHDQNHLYLICVHDSPYELWIRPAEVLAHRSGLFVVYLFCDFVLIWNNSHLLPGITRNPASQARHVLALAPTIAPAWDWVRPRARRVVRMRVGLGIGFLPISLVKTAPFFVNFFI